MIENSIFCRSPYGMPAQKRVYTLSLVRSVSMKCVTLRNDWRIGSLFFALTFTMRERRFSVSAHCIPRLVLGTLDRPIGLWYSGGCFLDPTSLHPRTWG